MKIPMHECASSLISEHGYDATTHTLAVRFKRGGKLYHYEDVPADIYRAMEKAPSLGSFFLANIKDQYKFTIIEEK